MGLSMRLLKKGDPSDVVIVVVVVVEYYCFLRIIVVVVVAPPRSRASATVWPLLLKSRSSCRRNAS